MAERDVMVMMSRTTFWDIEDRQAQYDALCPDGIEGRGEGRSLGLPGVVGVPRRALGSSLRFFTTAKSLTERMLQSRDFAASGPR
jgi:hypothetical protein